MTIVPHSSPLPHIVSTGHVAPVIEFCSRVSSSHPSPRPIISGWRVASAAAPPGTSLPALHPGRLGPRSCQSSARTMRWSRAWLRKCPLRAKKVCQVLHEFMCFTLSNLNGRYLQLRFRKWQLICSSRPPLEWCLWPILLNQTFNFHCKSFVHIHMYIYIYIRVFQESILGQ